MTHDFELYFPSHWTLDQCHEAIPNNLLFWPLRLKLHRGHNGVQFWFTFMCYAKIL